MAGHGSCQWSRFDYIKTTALGLKAAGASLLNVGEISCCIKLHLEAAAKAFTTVESLCDHMRVCTRVKIIKDWASGTGQHAAAWKEGDNMLIASRNMVKAGTQLTLTLVEAAITLAQLHLTELPPKEVTTKSYKTKLETVEDEDEDINTDPVLLTQHIAKKLLVLAMLQKGPPGWITAGPWRLARRQRRRTWQWNREAFRPSMQVVRATLNVCCKWHTGKPPEDSCYKCYVAVEHIKLGEGKA
eukprot:3247328-Rhodomonas_salina.3